MKFNSYYFIKLLPFIFVIVSDFLTFLSPLLSFVFKICSLLTMCLYFLKRNMSLNLIVSVLVFSPFFIYGFFISFSLKAAAEEGIRYFFPIIVLFYSYALKKDFHFILKVFIIYMVCSFVAQILHYVFWSLDVKHQWFYIPLKNGLFYFNKSMGIMRAVGLFGFFAVYGFFNLIMHFLIRFFYVGKNKKIFLLISVFGVLSSLSFKSIFLLLLLNLILSKQAFNIISASVFIFTFTLLIKPSILKDISYQIEYRIKTYITNGNSARTESYRVMNEEISNGNFFGHGVGSFGGPASLKYNSPLYKKVNFNWFGLNYLKTTDTYIPHPFVELGLFGGFVYLFIFIVPLILKRNYKIRILFMLFIIYFSLFFDSLFAYAFNNLSYLLVSLFLIYPLLNIVKENEGV